MLLKFQQIKSENIMIWALTPKTAKWYGITENIQNTMPYLPGLCVWGEGRGGCSHVIGSGHTEVIDDVMWKCLSHGICATNRTSVSCKDKKTQARLTFANWLQTDRLQTICFWQFDPRAWKHTC